MLTKIVGRVDVGRANEGKTCEMLDDSFRRSEIHYSALF